MDRVPWPDRQGDCIAARGWFERRGFGDLGSTRRGRGPPAGDLARDATLHGNRGETRLHRAVAGPECGAAGAGGSEAMIPRDRSDGVGYLYLAGGASILGLLFGLMMATQWLGSNAIPIWIGSLITLVIIANGPIG